MSLEQTLEKNTAAMIELTAALKAGGGKPGTVAGKPGSATSVTPAISHEDVKAAVVKVKDVISAAAAKKIIAEVGKAKELAAIKKPEFAAVIAACEEALGAADEPAPEDDSL